MWNRGAREHGNRETRRQPIGRVGPMELGVILVSDAISTIALWKTLQYFGGSASFWDALTTSISIASQWMLNRKQLESWMGWIVVDMIYVP